MQKRKRASLLAMILAGIVAFPFGATAKEKDNKPESTPENSVLVYGGVGDSTALVRFTQTDPAFKPGTRESWSLRFFFDDIEPGSYLKLTYYESRDVLAFQSHSPAGWTVTGGDRYSVNLPGLQGTTPLDFRVQGKPGLQYLGCRSEAYVDGAMTFVPATWAKKAPNPEREYELFVLKMVLKEKTGTAWEPVIRARMKELGYDK
jgi:hypothetical protein